MRKTKRNKIKKNKTLKITNSKKTNFIHEIVKEWVIQTKGRVVMDKKTEYKYDYYLLFSNYDDYNNHIHLLLNNYHDDHNNYNNIKYMLKKYDIKTKTIIHSKKYKINIFSDPVKIVYNMIENYNKFINN